MFEEVTKHVNQIIGRQKSSTSESDFRSQFAARADTVTSCSSNSQCLINGSKRKCHPVLHKCVECYKKYQCVKDGKFKCNLQTLTCEAGSVLRGSVGVFNKKVAEQTIIAPLEEVKESISEVKSKLVPNLIATMR